MNSCVPFATLVFALIVIAGPVEGQSGPNDFGEQTSQLTAEANTHGHSSILAPEVAQAMEKLFEPWNKPDVPGVAVAVARDGKTLFSKGYGMANLEYSIPVTPKTVFHIASVSKQFTVFAVLLLEEQGKLSMDDSVRKYIPEVPDFGHNITLRHLAHHTSGLRDQWSLLTMAGWRMDDVITREQILQLISKQQELNFKPGERYTYCNTGYTLLAEVVARVSGQSFAQFAQDNLFEPLDMNDTLFYDDHEKIVVNRAYSYKRKNGRLAKSVLSYANVGATSLFTTAEDLTKWAGNFDDPVVGNRELLARMNSKGILNNGQEINYALGQIVGNYRGLPTIGHAGGDAGYRTNLTRFPEQRFSVVLLGNDANFNPVAINNKIVDLFLKDELGSVTTTTDDNQAKKTNETPVPEEKKIDADVLKRYQGVYPLQPGLELEISQKDGVLFGKATGRPEFKFTAVSETEFVFPPANIEMSFAYDEEQKQPEMTFKRGGLNIKLTPSGRFDPASVNLADYEGMYQSAELSTEYEFVVSDDQSKLLLKHARHPQAVARTIAVDHFLAPNLGRIQFLRDDQQNVTGFKASTGRVLNLKFRKKD